MKKRKWQKGNRAAFVGFRARLLGPLFVTVPGKPSYLLDGVYSDVRPSPEEEWQIRRQLRVRRGATAATEYKDYLRWRAVRDAHSEGFSLHRSKKRKSVVKQPTPLPDKRLEGSFAAGGKVTANEDPAYQEVSEARD